MTVSLALASAIASSSLLLSPIAPIIITGPFLWSHLPIQTTHYFDRTYAASKDDESVFGFTFRSTIKDSSTSAWMRKHTPAPEQHPYAWIPITITQRHWNGSSKTVLDEGWKWSMLAAQLVGCSKLFGEDSAVRALKVFQDTNQTFAAAQKAYQMAIVGNNSMSIGYFSSPDSSGLIVRANPGHLAFSVDQKKWVLATCGILTEMNQGDHELLGARHPDQQNQMTQRDSLERWWGVKNRQDLLETLVWIDTGGHRQDFSETGAYLTTLDAKSLSTLKVKANDNLEAVNKIDLALKYYSSFGKKSLIGWDYSRYVALCGWGYVAGYLSEQEAWEKMMPVARRLQQTFDSWEDLGNNYIVGRKFWSYRQTVRNGLDAEDAYKRLCANTNSPWVRLKWKLPLPSE